jgi:hypothetical protein
MTSILKILGVSKQELPISILGLLFIFSLSSAYSQSDIVDGNCPSCKYEQAQYDSINIVFNKAKDKLSVALKNVTKTKQLLEDAQQTSEANDLIATREKELEEANTQVEKARTKFNPIEKELADAQQHLESCFDNTNPSICMKCQDGKEVIDNNAFCDDGDPCTINDRCVNGICIGDPVTSSENPNCGGN